MPSEEKISILVKTVILFSTKYKISPSDIVSHENDILSIVYLSLKGITYLNMKKKRGRRSEKTARREAEEKAVKRRKP